MKTNEQRIAELEERVEKLEKEVNKSKTNSFSNQGEKVEDQELCDYLF